MIRKCMLLAFTALLAIPAGALAEQPASSGILLLAQAPPPPPAVTPPPPPPGTRPTVPPPPQYRRSGRQARDLARCNQYQATCARRCEYRHGRARTYCYNQCNAQFVACTNRANARR